MTTRGQIRFASGVVVGVVFGTLFAFFISTRVGVGGSGGVLRPTSSSRASNELSLASGGGKVTSDSLRGTGVDGVAVNGAIDVDGSNDGHAAQQQQQQQPWLGSGIKRHGEGGGSGNSGDEGHENSCPPCEVQQRDGGGDEEATTDCPPPPTAITTQRHQPSTPASQQRDEVLQRASFVGYDPSTSPFSCRDLEQVLDSPFTPSGGQQPLFLDWYYQCVYEPMVLKKSIPFRAIVWKRAPKETHGFGNQLRAQYGTFIVALVTRRLFLVDDKMFDFYFKPPPSIDWRYSKHLHLLPNKPKEYEFDRKKIKDDLPSINPSTWLKKYDVVRSSVHFSVDAELGDNPLVQRMYERVLFGTLSGYKRIGMVIEWMLQRPAKKLQDEAAAARKRMGFGNEPFMAVQFRTFKSGKHFDKFVADADNGVLFRCLDKIIDHWKTGQGSGGQKRVVPRNIFFTTDRDRVFSLDRMTKELKHHGKVFMNYSPKGKGSYEPSGKLGARAWKQVSQALVDWYLLGDAQPSINGGTSFGVSAAARVGFSNDMFVLAGAKLCEDDYPFPPRLRTDVWRDLTI